ncbi:MAG: hypothetical protein F6J97_14555 [Leptolyngbya sp. SIO4C1]|nr:hypothetical protein [Leptolyngbya sp. SIO4C1]
MSCVRRGAGIAIAIALIGCQPEAPPPTSEVPLPKDAAPSGAPPPPPPPADSFFALLPPEATAALEALEISAAVPSYLPAGFSLADYEAGQGGVSGADGRPYYWLIYRDAQNHCFAIEFTSGGVGGPELENQLPIESPLFGPGYSLHYGQYADSGLREQFPEPDLFSDWMAGEQGLYRLAGAEQIMQTYEQSGCRNLPPEEALRVVESLTYLRSDLLGEELEDE